MNWIKLTDNKPPLNARVLVMRQVYSIHDTIHFTSIDVVQYRAPPEQDEKNQTKHNVIAVGEFPVNDVTHWMPIPESEKQLSNITLVRMYTEKLQEETK